jgi:hypothetical protein
LIGNGRHLDSKTGKFVNLSNIQNTFFQNTNNNNRFNSVPACLLELTCNPALIPDFVNSNLNNTGNNRGQGRGKPPPPPPPRNNFSGSLQRINDDDVKALSAQCGAHLRSAVYNFFVQKPGIACRMYEGYAQITTYNNGTAIKNVSSWYKDKNNQNVWGGEQTAFIVANMLAVPIILCAANTR